MGETSTYTGSNFRIGSFTINVLDIPSDSPLVLGMAMPLFVVEGSIIILNDSSLRITTIPTHKWLIFPGSKIENFGWFLIDPKPTIMSAQGMIGTFLIFAII
jgi:hypothetical protein